MKKNLLHFICILVSLNMLHAQAWKTLGNKIISNNGSKMTFTVAADGTVYGIYNNSMNANLLNAVKWNGNAWVSIGDDFSAGSAGAMSITTDNTNTPYVVYRDRKKDEKAVVMKYDGKSWSAVGAELADGYINGSSITFDKSNVPYVALTDQKAGKLRVYKLAGDKWMELASPFDETGDQVTILCSNNTTYLSYADTRNGNKIAVKKYDEKTNSWVVVGKTYVSEKEAKYSSLAIDSKGNPIVAFQNTFFGGQIVVKKLGNDAWQKVGEDVFSSSYNDNLSLTVINDVPYVAYHNSSNYDHKLDVKKFNGSAWVDAGGSAGKGGDGFNSIYARNNALFVNFNEADNGAVIKTLTVN